MDDSNTKRALDEFDEEIEVLKKSPDFLNMLRFNEDLEEHDRMETALNFHAFKAVNSQIFRSPLVIGTYVRHCFHMGSRTGEVVAEAIKVWGLADYFDQPGPA